MSLTNLNYKEESREITIADNGKLVELNYSGLEDFHTGDSWFGCTVGYRAMQIASVNLSTKTIWERDNLYIVSAHPGNGVLDAIEFVTCCISKNRFNLTPKVADKTHCSRDMEFEWWVSDGRTTINIKLRNGIIPDSFYDLLDRINSDLADSKDKNDFSNIKLNLSAHLWQISHQSSFSIECLPRPLSIGEIPNA